MATHYVPMQGMARIGAESASPCRSPYLYEPQGVAIPYTLWGIATTRVLLVQIGPSSPRK
jgi:hypothetical protein